MHEAAAKGTARAATTAATHASSFLRTAITLRFVSQRPTRSALNAGGRTISAASSPFATSAPTRTAGADLAHDIDDARRPRGAQPRRARGDLRAEDENGARALAGLIASILRRSSL